MATKAKAPKAGKNTNGVASVAVPQYEIVRPAHSILIRVDGDDSTAVTNAFVAALHRAGDAVARGVDLHSDEKKNGVIASVTVTVGKK